MKVSELIVRLQKIKGDPEVIIRDDEIAENWTRVVDIAEFDGGGAVLVMVAP